MAAAQTQRSVVDWTNFITLAPATAGGSMRARTCGMTRPAQLPESEFEARLISRIAEGDESAFTALYERFSASLYGMAFRMMNDAKEAEDVLQEGFTYIWRKAASYDSSRSSPFAWAVMIVRNKAIDRLRVRQRWERLRDKVTTEGSFDQQKDETSADEPTLRERGALVREESVHPLRSHLFQIGRAHV